MLRDACDEAVAGGAACAVCTGVDANGVPVVPPDGCSKHDVRGFCADLPGGANGSSARNITMETTFYGARDNCPPGGAIAYPLLHPVAGGTGTYADPITFAGSKKALPKHTRVYVVELQKYFIMEDDCGECDHDWEHKQKYQCDHTSSRTHCLLTLRQPRLSHFSAAFLCGFQHRPVDRLRQVGRGPAAHCLRERVDQVSPRGDGRPTSQPGRKQHAALHRVQRLHPTASTCVPRHGYCLR